MKERGRVQALPANTLRFTLIGPAEVLYTSLNQSQGPERMEYTDWLKLFKPHSFPKEIQDSVSRKEGKW